MPSCAKQAQQMSSSKISTKIIIFQNKFTFVNSKDCFKITTWHSWQDVYYYINSKITKCLLNFCCSGIGSVSSIFLFKNYQFYVLKSQKIRANVSATYGGPLKCHKLNDYFKISEKDWNIGNIENNCNHKAQKYYLT